MPAAKIAQLTPEQVARIPESRDAWLRHGLSTERADRPRAEAGVKIAYEAAGLKPPALVIWLDSPMAGAMGAALLAETAKAGSQVRSQVWSQVRSQVRSQVEAQVWSQVEAQVWSQVRSQVEAQVWSQVRSQVEAQVWSQVRSQVGSQVEAQVEAQVGRALWGQHDAGWLSLYAYFADVCGLECVAPMRGLIEVSRSSGWWWPFEGAVILTERPVAIHRDAEFRLHHETGPSLLYPDGWAIHAWHGTRVPAHWIEQKDTVDPSEIIRAENVEQRAAGAAIIGWPRMLSVLKSRTINDSGSPDIGELIELELPGLSEPGRFLKALCPRNGIIVEGVPRVSDIDGLSIETALHAQAWRIGDPLSEYQHPPSRT